MFYFIMCACVKGPAKEHKRHVNSAPSVRLRGGGGGGASGGRGPACCFTFLSLDDRVGMVTGCSSPWGPRAARSLQAFVTRRLVTVVVVVVGKHTFQHFRFPAFYQFKATK